MTALIAYLVPMAARAQSGGGGGPIPSQHTTIGSLEGSHVFSGLKAANISVSWGTIAARWLQIYDETTVTGGSTTNMVWCQPLSGSGTAVGSQTFTFPNPLQNFTGVAVVVSTNASGCTATTTDGANDFIFGQVY